MVKRRRQRAALRSIPWMPPPAPTAPPPAVDPERRRILRGLRDLAREAAASLRYHPDQQVRRALALLVAASVAAAAACDVEEPLPEPTAIERPARMANLGFPAAAGRYEVQQDSVQMDTGGNYHLYWLDPSRANAPQLARGGDLRLVEDQRTFLEVGNDLRPVLHLKTEDSIGLVDPMSMQAQATPTPGAQSSGGLYPHYAFWYPFFTPGGTRTVIVETDRGREADRTARATPGYYQPPLTDVEPGRAVSGGTRTATAPASSPGFTLGAGARAVSGLAGGTGAGAAATSKSGVSAPRSSGFFGGTGAGSAATAKGSSA